MQCVDMRLKITYGIVNSQIHIKIISRLIKIKYKLINNEDILISFCI